MNQVQVKRIKAGSYKAIVDGLKFTIYASYCESKPQWIVENQYENEVFDCFEFKNYAIEALQLWPIDELKRRSQKEFNNLNNNY